MNDFGRRLQEIRTDAGLTQSGLARALNTSQSAISQMERGEREPSFRMLRRLARALGVSPGHLLGRDVDELSPAEQVHFRQYRSLPDEAKEEIRHFAEYLSQKHTKSG
ncbi:MAG: XRE family transcriptional regulator [Gemmatimonadota bacterium]|nr:XRE family transcriptional regulator [Gemmatimonadota bacterium]